MLPGGLGTLHVLIHLIPQKSYNAVNVLLGFKNVFKTFNLGKFQTYTKVERMLQRIFHYPLPSFNN